MLTRTQQRQFLAIALVVVGLLLLFGNFSLGLLVVIGAIAGVALGIVLLLDNRQESRVLGIVLLLVSALLFLAPRFFHSIVEAVNILGGLAMVVVGLWILWGIRKGTPAWR
ncbi:MAG: hypothetical protein QOD77_1985 [Thermoplasmata archaeon]|nr:hypothetical protein [Thermoplasmata archaeon]